MSREMLNDQTWSSQEVRSAFAPGRASMSYGGVAVKTGLFLVVIAALAAVGWVTSETFTGRGSGLVYLVGFIVLIGLSIAAVHNPRLALLAGLLYAVLNGLWIGAISRYYDEVFDGIVGVALLGTLAVCVGVLLLFSVAGFRVTARGRRSSPCWWSGSGSCTCSAGSSPSSESTWTSCTGRRRPRSSSV